MIEKNYQLKKTFFLIFILGLVGFFAYSYFAALRNGSRINSPVSIFKSGNPGTQGQVLEKQSQQGKNSPGLARAVSGALTGVKGDYGIVIRNLKTGEVYEQNAHTVFPPASMYKLWVMAVVFSQVEQGKMTLDSVMSDNVVDLNKEFHIKDEEAELTDGGFTFTVGEALERMIVVSHNYAAFMLTDKIGLKSIVPFLRENGLLESKVGTGGDLPTSTPSDMALFFEKLYNGKLASPIVTQEMITLLKKQQLNYALPKYLPVGVEIAHKTGNIDQFTHDGGIVYSKKGDYLIVIMTKSNDPEAAEERMALVSKVVWEEMGK